MKNSACHDVRLKPSSRPGSFTGISVDELCKPVKGDLDLSLDPAAARAAEEKVRVAQLADTMAQQARSESDRLARGREARRRRRHQRKRPNK